MGPCVVGEDGRVDRFSFFDVVRAYPPPIEVVLEPPQLVVAEVWCGVCRGERAWQIFCLRLSCHAATLSPGQTRQSPCNYHVREALHFFFFLRSCCAVTRGTLQCQLWVQQGTIHCMVL